MMGYTNQCLNPHFLGLGFKKLWFASYQINISIISHIDQGGHDRKSTFSQYLIKYLFYHFSNGTFSHNAQYWIGEAHYVTRRFNDAEKAFRVLIEKYPNSNKDPDARLKLGYVYYELKQWDNARKTLAEIVQRYPTSKAASLAEKRLLVMTQEKR